MYVSAYVIVMLDALYTYVRMYLNMHIYMRMYLSMCMRMYILYVCIYVCVYACTCMCAMQRNAEWKCNAHTAIRTNPIEIANDASCAIVDVKVYDCTCNATEAVLQISCTRHARGI